MEASPLTLAHDHARAASNATHTSDTAIAITEHTLAAGEFARCAETTGSAEALRTLRLLEEHHQRLSELLKTPEDQLLVQHAEPQPTETLEKPSEETIVPGPNETKNDAILKQHPRRTNPAASGIYVPRRMPNREMSSSIASNLASARGIRSTHDRRALSPSVTTKQVPGNLEVPVRRRNEGVPAPVAGKPTWLPPVTEASKAEAQISPSKAERTAAPTTSPVEEGFQRWTSTFGNLISKISAPLAFAGLPLSIDEPASAEPKEPAIKQRQQKSSIPTKEPNDPDLTKIFSKSALSTLRHHNHGGDSFYVVPTTGHTVSYSNILSYGEKEKRRMAASITSNSRNSFESADNDDFVDARESFGPQTSSLSRPLNAKRAKGPKEVENMVEELCTENQSLKDCIDQLTRRLHSFEMAAQSSGLAMQESMRFIRPTSPSAQRDSGTAQEVRDLKEQMDLAHKDMARLERENEKLKSVIERYRERWEKLKEGAKTRRGDGGTSTPRGAGAQNDTAAAAAGKSAAG